MAGAHGKSFASLESVSTKGSTGHPGGLFQMLLLLFNDRLDCNNNNNLPRR